MEQEMCDFEKELTQKDAAQYYKDQPTSGYHLKSVEEVSLVGPWEAMQVESARGMAKIKELLHEIQAAMDKASETQEQFSPNENADDDQGYADEFQWIVEEPYDNEDLIGEKYWWLNAD